MVVVVDASPHTQLRRLVDGRGMSEEQARERMRAQASREERLAVADVVIDNNDDREALVNQVEKLWVRLTTRA